MITNAININFEPSGDASAAMTAPPTTRSISGLIPGFSTDQFIAPFNLHFVDDQTISARSAKQELSGRGTK
ncbi:hypothetical protein [Manganibacter manganicus]|uniref:Uncharacterized protein n=1 Tax=Manganibacter manganicus TaxID=1873176 RepID=A0A1V8RUB1_9HYPH|nr:hypothetical protein [Pseudaminobacter manganicus]OQM76733.1 hypothetical protein BFN67_12550 [Pseudaminobacter manganicus]